MEIFVISVMSEKIISEKKMLKINRIIQSVYNDISLEYNSYKYEDDLYFDTDIDIKGIVFKNSFEEEKIKISKLLVKILIELDCFADILAGYQDTSGYVEVYQKNRYKGLVSSGIIATNTDLERNDLFYKKDGINVYFNNQKERLGKYYNSYIYPMGTVIRLNDETREDKISAYSYMIIDRFVLNDENSMEYYEYKANVYPTGSLPNGKGIIFNNEDISLVEFVGYETAIDRNIVEDVKKKLEGKGISKKY